MCFGNGLLHERYRQVKKLKRASICLVVNFFLKNIQLRDIRLIIETFAAINIFEVNFVHRL